MILLRAYPTQPYCLLSPIGPSVILRPTYRPPSLLHSLPFLDLLSSLHTPIWPQTLCWSWHYNKSPSYPRRREYTGFLLARNKRPSLIKNTLGLSTIQTSHIQKIPTSQPTSFERTHITLLRLSKSASSIKKRVLHRLSKIFFSAPHFSTSYPLSCTATPLTPGGVWCYQKNSTQDTHILCGDSIDPKTSLLSPPQGNIFSTPKKKKKKKKTVNRNLNITIATHITLAFASTTKSRTPHESGLTRLTLVERSVREIHPWHSTRKHRNSYIITHHDFSSPKHYINTKIRPSTTTITYISWPALSYIRRPTYSLFTSQLATATYATCAALSFCWGSLSTISTTGEPIGESGATRPRIVWWHCIFSSASATKPWNAENASTS